MARRSVLTMPVSSTALMSTCLEEKLMLKGSFATFRLTHLIQDDVITKPMREKIQLLIEQNTEAGSQLQNNLLYLLSCHWCLSMYVATVVTLIEDKKFDIVKVLAYSGVSSVVDHVQSRIF